MKYFLSGFSGNYYIAGTVVLFYSESDVITEKARKIKKILFILLSINIFLFLIKFIPNLFFKSLSVEADAFNSLEDFIYALILLVGVHFAYLPKDKSHPHGHERIRPFLSLIIAVAIFMAGGLVVKQAVESLLYGPVYEFTPLFVPALLGSIAVKYSLFCFLKKRGDDLESDLLLDASRDSKVDTLASLSALVGVVGAHLGFLYLDVTFGLLVSVWIFKTAFEIGRKNFGFLTGAAPPQGVKQEIGEVLDHEDIKQTLQIEAHYVGPKLHVSCQVEVSQDYDFNEAHALEEKIKKNLEEIPEVNTAYVHLEPSTKGNK